MRRLVPTLTCLLILAAAPAQARFGKRQSDGDESPQRPSSAQSSNSGGDDTHEASAVGSYRGGGASPSYRAYRHGRGERHYRRYGFGYWYAPPPVVVYGSPAAPPEEGNVPAITGALGAEAGAFRGGGASLGLSLAAEGERFGVGLQFTGILIGADDGSGGLDSIKLFNAQLSYAFLSVDGARLRVEGGVHSAFAPDLIVAGPGFGLSGAAHLAGPVGLEAALRVTPFPFRQLDASAALTLSFGWLGLRGGWRHVILDDAGLVDGYRNVDTFSGPFVGLALLL